VGIRFSFIVFTLGILLGSRANAELHPDCMAADIVQVSVPLDYAVADSPHFNMRFKYHPGDGAKPIVIVLPGGPGGFLIPGADGKEMLGAVPKSFGYVLTDPRGAGCNDEPSLNEDRFFRSRWLALDVLQIVKKLEETNHGALKYVLYGQSYGTSQATLAAHLAEQEKVTPPKVVVLEGVVGHSFQDFAEYFQAIQEEWHYARSALPADVRRKFMTGSFPLAPSKVWAQFVEGEILRGFHPTRGSTLNWHFTGSGGMALMTELGGIAASTQNGELVVPNRVGQVIACRELFGDLHMLRDFSNGELISLGDDVCVGADHGIQEPFDSKQWPLSMPIVYFEGDHDAATPPAQARYHFESQTHTKRYYVSLDLAAHAPLTTSLKINDCPDQIWQSLIGDLSVLPKALDYCDSLQPAKVRVEVRDSDESS
jgi:pimeloyl-ACP methyl ester carboxylesterase